MAALKHLAKMPMGYFDANPSGKLRKIIDDNSFQTETFIAHQLPDLVGAQVTMIVSSESQIRLGKAEKEERIGDQAL